MSQKASRKSAVTDEKDKRQTDSPVKEMKKKMAANAEKEKQAAEKSAEKPVEKADKPAEKSAEKDKTIDKKAEKTVEKDKTVDKKAEKTTEKDKTVDKKAEKTAEKKEVHPEKGKEENKGEKSGKTDKPDEQKKSDVKPKQNGSDVTGGVHNGVSDVTLSTNGTEEVLNGTSRVESDEESGAEADEQDELFPELAYDDTSDVDFEPEHAAGRSLTRRSQVKATRTPETPRPASDKQTDKDTNADDSKESKLLKMKDDAAPTDRKLRSADSPKRQDPKKQETKKQESPKTQEQDKGEEHKKGTEKSQEPKKDLGKEESKKGIEKEEKKGVDKEESSSDKKNDGAEEKSQEKEKMEVEVVIEVEEAEEEPRKVDTNYSKSRVKVSPYRRSMRLAAADHTGASLTGNTSAMGNTSVMANYTGNNTTMEMDITETSSFVSEDPSLDDSSYLSGLRNIRGRRSYKPLKEMTLRHITANKTVRSTATVLEPQSRPTGTVVGRKRKPDNEDSVELGVEPETESTAITHGKRIRLLDRLAQPFRRTVHLHSTPLPARRAAEIVGINTDLPLTAPVSTPTTFDPESLKPAPPVPPTVPPVVPVTPVNPLHDERDSKRCVVM